MEALLFLKKESLASHGAPPLLPPGPSTADGSTSRALMRDGDLGTRRGKG